jgi:proteic killer suppression protein
MIRSYRCDETELIFNGGTSRRFPPEIQKTALRKLRQLHGARRLGELAHPPGNELEQLSGDRAGEWSIRINRQWRICFIWDDDAYEVEITDYH